MATEADKSNPLNDVMIAMDVVDTLRHDAKLVERELNDQSRRDELIGRLREIYEGQGITVPDSVLEEGVRALEQDRFVYKPQEPGSMKSRIARAYVTRGAWGRYVLGALFGILIIALGNYLIVQRPKAKRLAQQQYELNERLPASLTKLLSAINGEAKSEEVRAQSSDLAKSGLNAASNGNLKTATAAEATLKQTLEQLRQDFKVRVINRRGEVSGLWRIPASNPNTYNFYLVVEAIGRDGKPIPQTIMNEETGKAERVTTWAVRVNRDVLERIRRDKEDDGIIQSAIIGDKKRGEFKPSWSIPVQGGAITRWRQPR